MHPTTALPHRLIRALPLGVLALLAACSTPPTPVPPGGPVVGTPTPPPTGTPSPTTPAPGGAKTSYATDPRSYRRDAAAHLYALNPGRIYTGKLPPLLYAVGVMQVELDARGQVRQFGWMRAPKHAPEVCLPIAPALELFRSPPNMNAFLRAALAPGQCHMPTAPRKAARRPPPRPLPRLQST